MTSVAVTIRIPGKEEKVISKECSKEINSLITAIHSVRNETNAYLTDLVDQGKGGNVSAVTSSGTAGKDDVEGEGEDDASSEESDEAHEKAKKRKTKEPV